jgi:hypothetical protein
MAIYTTLFLCDPAALLGGFPGWKAALDQPVRREVLNPFTGELMVTESRAPEWPDDEGGETLFPPQYEAVTINVPYEQYLESRLPTFVRQLPHWASKGLLSTEFAPLLETIGFHEELDMPIYGPPSTGDVVEEFPADFLARVATSDLTNVAQQWAATMSTPEHTHSVSGKRIYDDWTPSQAMEVLNPMLGLSRASNASQRLYLLTEC